jgi:hypothetical protein
LPVERPPGAGKRWRRANTGYVHPPQTAPGLGPPCPWNGAWIQLCRNHAERYLVLNPAAAYLVGARLSRAAPGGGDPYCLSLSLASVLLFANLFTSALASERGFYAFLLTGFQVKGVAFYFFNDVFLLHFALETAQSVFERFPLLQSNFRQTDTPPNPSGRTE